MLNPAPLGVKAARGTTPHPEQKALRGCNLGGPFYCSQAIVRHHRIKVNKIIPEREINLAYIYLLC